MSWFGGAVERKHMEEEEDEGGWWIEGRVGIEDAGLRTRRGVDGGLGS